jgi:hypothetical protein
LILGDTRGEISDAEAAVSAIAIFSTGSRRRLTAPVMKSGKAKKSPSVDARALAPN